MGSLHLHSRRHNAGQGARRVYSGEELRRMESGGGVSKGIEWDRVLHSSHIFQLKDKCCFEAFHVVEELSFLKARALTKPSPDLARSQCMSCSNHSAAYHATYWLFDIEPDNGPVNNMHSSSSQLNALCSSQDIVCMPLVERNQDMVIRTHIHKPLQEYLELDCY